MFSQMMPISFCRGQKIIGTLIQTIRTSKPPPANGSFPYSVVGDRGSPLAVIRSIPTAGTTIPNPFTALRTGSHGPEQEDTRVAKHVGALSIPGPRSGKA